MRQLVVQMHGEPGSGKSTLARELGRRLGAIALDKDVIKAALLRAGVPEQQAAAAAYETFFAQARALIEDGHSVVLDNPVFWESVERRWLELSALVAAPPLLLECVCSDVGELERRLATRRVLESQPRQRLDLARHPGAVPTTFQPRATIDTTRPLDECVEQALRFVESHWGAAGQASPGGPFTARTP